MSTSKFVSARTGGTGFGTRGQYGVGAGAAGVASQRVPLLNLSRIRYRDAANLLGSTSIGSASERSRGNNQAPLSVAYKTGPRHPAVTSYRGKPNYHSSKQFEGDMGGVRGLPLQSIVGAPPGASRGIKAEHDQSEGSGLEIQTSRTQKDGRYRTDHMALPGSQTARVSGTSGNQIHRTHVPLRYNYQATTTIHAEKRQGGNRYVPQPPSAPRPAEAGPRGRYMRGAAAVPTGSATIPKPPSQDQGDHSYAPRTLRRDISTTSSKSKLTASTSQKYVPKPPSSGIPSSVSTVHDQAQKAMNRTPSKPQLQHSSSKSRTVPQQQPAIEPGLTQSKSRAAAEPLTPAAAIKLYGNSLTPYEQSEILDYPQVYCVGHNAAKHTRQVSGPNRGYDDDRGEYLVIQHDHLAYRFEVLSTLGKGSFGQALKCFDYKRNAVVALKVIRNKKRFHHQALVEVRILEYIRKADPEDKHAIVRTYDSFYFRNHLCIVFECLSINLYEFVKNNKFQGFSLGLIRRFAVQLLHALSFLDKRRIIHCDMKPENILLKHPNKSGIKIIDFGSSCFEHERVYTYIQSRFYRAPEVILGLPYEVGIDVWSVGCILAELYTGYPLFPGENEVEQLLCIMEVCDVPTKKMIESSSRYKLFFDSNLNPRVVPNSRGKKRRPGTRDLATAIKSPDAQFLDFLRQCLVIDPKERLRPDEGLRHQWITDGAAPAPERPIGGVPQKHRRYLKFEFHLKTDINSNKSYKAVPPAGPKKEEVEVKQKESTTQQTVFHLDSAKKDEMFPPIGR